MAQIFVSAWLTFSLALVAQIFVSAWLKYSLTFTPGIFSDLEEEYCSNPDVGKCSVFHEGQEFIVDKENYLTMLNGQFCSEAWAAINH